MITKYDSYHDKIENVTKKIVNDQGFSGSGANSQAFGYWFLEHSTNLSNEDINESMIDGNGDNGIDAYVYNEEDKTLALYQFKWPHAKNVNGEIDQSAILKMFQGVETLMTGDQERSNVNSGFDSLAELISDKEVFEINIYFVSYNKGIVSEENKSIVTQKENKFSENMKFNVHIIDRDNIINLYDKLQRNNNVSISLKYSNIQSSYSVEGDKNIESWVGAVKATDLISAISNKLDYVFDENIRLYEKKSKINEGITKTACDMKAAKMFYFYNNGITIICDKAKNSPGSNSIRLDGISIVNGCQTVTSLVNASNLGKLREDVNLLVRIIQINTYGERELITEYLNSQTPIKESYFVANNSNIRELQKELLKKDYFLERQINELSYKIKYGENVDKKFNDDHVLKLEDVVQHYVAAFKNKHASQAKRGKGSLFDKNNVEEMLSGINAEKVIEAEKDYGKIAQVITKYRKNRRNNENEEFSSFLGIKKEKYNSDEYMFVNTSDLLILNAVENLKKRKIKKNNKHEDFNDLIIKAIDIIKTTINENESLKKSAPALVTKNATLYKKVQEKIFSLDSNTSSKVSNQ